MSLKQRISSPLEAGTSVLDGRDLPRQLTPCLEHVSSVLARRKLHLTLVAVRRDYHLPVAVASYGPASSPPCSFSSSSSSSSFSKLGFATSTISALKQLVWKRGVKTRAGCDGESRGWPLSVATDDHVGAISTGVRFLHAPDLSIRDEKMLRKAFTKTARRFHLGDGLAPAESPVSVGLSSQLFTNSLLQHEVLFSSDGLTILSLDRLYSLKAALASYSRTKSHLRLEDAVDELRRYVLAGNGARLTKAHLCRAYDWLNVCAGAVSDLDAMYRKAYGAADQFGAITGLDMSPLRRDESPAEELDFQDAAHASQIGLAITTLEPVRAAPCLTIQTAFSPRLRDEEDALDTDALENPTRSDGDCAACLQVPPSIDQLLCSEAGVSGDGPVTPNGYEDISPVTRGEWRFLLVDESFRGRRTVAVETC